MITIRPSIASANPIDIKGEIARLGRHETYLHIDLEDGNYLDNISFGLKTVKAITCCTKAECDVHITATNPARFVAPLAEMGVSAVCFHYELATHPAEILGQIRRLGMKAGVALSFKTPPEALEMFVKNLDFVLFMTAEPDYAGEQFCSDILPRIKRARAMLPPHVSIWADGGIDQSTLLQVLQSGADTVVMGRAVWKAENAPAALDRYYEMAASLGG